VFTAVIVGAEIAQLTRKMIYMCVVRKVQETSATLTISSPAKVFGRLQLISCFWWTSTRTSSAGSRSSIQSFSSTYN